METCPKCDAHFPASETWERPPSLWVVTGWGFLNTNVRCPLCSSVFPAIEYRFFGLLSPKYFKTLYLGLLTSIILLAVCQWLFK
jgi:hypothetical protein